MTEIPSLWKFRTATAGERDSLKGPGQSLTVSRVAGNRENACPPTARPGSRVVAESCSPDLGFGSTPVTICTA